MDSKIIEILIQTNSKLYTIGAVINDHIPIKKKKKTIENVRHHIDISDIPTDKKTINKSVTDMCW